MQERRLRVLGTAIMSPLRLATRDRIADMKPSRAGATMLHGRSWAAACFGERSSGLVHTEDFETSFTFGHEGTTDGAASALDVQRDSTAMSIPVSALFVPLTAMSMPLSALSVPLTPTSIPLSASSVALTGLGGAASDSSIAPELATGRGGRSGTLARRRPPRGNGRVVAFKITVWIFRNGQRRGRVSHVACCALHAA